MLSILLFFFAVTVAASWMQSAARRSMSMSAAGRKKVCVIGGGFGGLYTALKLESKSQSLQKEACPLEITLIDPKDKFVFLPLLYELAVGTASVMEVAPRYCDLLDNTDIKFVQGSVECIDTDLRQVKLEGMDTEKMLEFDQLVIACGAQPNMNSLKGLQEHAIPFTGVEDSYRVKIALRSLLESDLDTINVAVLGAGYSGVEVATTIASFFRNRNRDANISIIDRNDRIMKTSPDFNRNTALKSLQDKGVDVIYSTSVQEITKDGLELRSKDSVDGAGEYFKGADLIIATLGIQQSPLLTSIGPSSLEIDSASGRLLVHETLQSMSNDDIFALGDCSRIKGVDLASTAQVAMQQADIVTKNILLKSEVGRDETASALERFTYVPLGEMLTLGATEAAISGIGGLVEIDGPLASAARRLVYAARMPTKEQTATALLNQLVSGAASVAMKVLDTET